jgi:hypothetical protein
MLFDAKWDFQTANLAVAFIYLPFWFSNLEWVGCFFYGFFLLHVVQNRTRNYTLSVPHKDEDIINFPPSCSYLSPHNQPCSPWTHESGLIVTLLPHHDTTISVSSNISMMFLFPSVCFEPVTPQRLTFCCYQQASYAWDCPCSVCA